MRAVAAPPGAHRVRRGTRCTPCVTGRRRAGGGDATFEHEGVAVATGDRLDLGPCARSSAGIPGPRGDEWEQPGGIPRECHAIASGSPRTSCPRRHRVAVVRRRRVLLDHRRLPPRGIAVEDYIQSSGDVLARPVRYAFPKGSHKSSILQPACSTRRMRTPDGGRGRIPHHRQSDTSDLGGDGTTTNGGRRRRRFTTGRGCFGAEERHLRTTGAARRGVDAPPTVAALTFLTSLVSATRRATPLTPSARGGNETPPLHGKVAFFPRTLVIPTPPAAVARE